MNIEDACEYEHSDTNIKRTGTYLEQKNWLMETVNAFG